MKKSELRGIVTKALRKYFDNVEMEMSFPDERASMTNAFPYLTIVFDKLTFDYTNVRGVQKLSIIGITKGGDNLVDLVDNMEENIFKATTEFGITNSITEVNNSNLFKPYGLDAGLFAPYGGVRFEIEIPNVKL